MNKIQALPVYFEGDSGLFVGLLSCSLTAVAVIMKSGDATDAWRSNTGHAEPSSPRSLVTIGAILVARSIVRPRTRLVDICTIRVLACIYGWWKAIEVSAYDWDLEATCALLQLHLQPPQSPTSYIHACSD